MDPGADAGRQVRRNVEGPRGARGPERGLALAGAPTAGMGLVHVALPPIVHRGDPLTGAPVLRPGLAPIHASLAAPIRAGLPRRAPGARS